MEDVDWYIQQAGDNVHSIEKFGSEDTYDLYEQLELDELQQPGAPPVVKGSKKLEAFMEEDEEGEDDDEPPPPPVKSRSKKGKAAAASGNNIPMTIGRPVVKPTKKEG
ncbi:unnamed protein product, partial [Discosporangium mesarthrocarpum]